MSSVPRYTEQVQVDAVAAVRARQLRNPRDRTIYREVAMQYDVGEQSLRLWVKKDEQERLDRRESEPSAASPEFTQMSKEELAHEVSVMKRRIEKLQAENDVLKKAFVVFSSEWSK